MLVKVRFSVARREGKAWKAETRGRGADGLLDEWRQCEVRRVQREGHASSVVSRGTGTGTREKEVRGR